MKPRFHLRARGRGAEGRAGLGNWPDRASALVADWSWTERDPLQDLIGEDRVTWIHYGASTGFEGRRGLEKPIESSRLIVLIGQQLRGSMRVLERLAPDTLACQHGQGSG